MKLLTIDGKQVGNTLGTERNATNSAQKRSYGKRQGNSNSNELKPMRSNHMDKITAMAQKQYKSLLMGPQAIGQNKGWKVQQLVFEAG